MDRRRIGLVTLGGMIGATLRWRVLTIASVGDFPWPTLVVNLIGCALVGFLIARPVADTARQQALTVGFCGGLTTFSTFAVEVALLRDAGAYAMWTYPLASIAGGLLAVLAGRRVARATLTTTGRPT